MQVADLLAALAGDIDDTRKWVDELRAELAQAEQKLTDLQVESKAVRNALGRYGEAEAAPLVAADPEWATLSRVDAVERALRESGPLHLTEIQSYLVQRGCERSSIGAISATLTNLNHHRSSVANVGKGRWDFVSDPTPENVAEAAGTTGTTPPAATANDPTEDSIPGPAKLVVVP